MARTLLPVLEEHGVDPGDDARSRQQGHDMATTLGDAGWKDFLRLFEPVTEDALIRYRRLIDLCPKSDKAVLRELLAHEEALKEFGRAELQGSAQTSLDDIQVVISKLLQLVPGGMEEH